MDALTSINLRLRRLQWQIAADNVLISLRSLARAVELVEAKANFNLGQPRDDRGRWTDSGNAPASRTGLPDAPKTPPKRPTASRERTRVVKEVAKWLAKAAARQALGPIGTVLTAIEVATWVHDYAPFIQSYLDQPKSLEELQAAVSSPKKGYDVHHIVEQTSAEQDGFHRSQIDSPENSVRIPTMKHWEINGWYMSENKKFQGLSPREYLRGKGWNERMKVGLEALFDHGVLKP